MEIKKDYIKIKKCDESEGFSKYKAVVGQEEGGLSRWEISYENILIDVIGRLNSQSSLDTVYDLEFEEAEGKLSYRQRTALEQVVQKHNRLVRCQHIAQETTDKMGEIL